MEAIREARRKEEEAKIAASKEKMDDTKEKVRRKRKPKGYRLGDEGENPEKIVDRMGKDGKAKKKVGFA